MTIIELKAQFYDLMAQKQQVELLMNQVNQQIQEAVDAQAADVNGPPAEAPTEVAEATQ